MKENLLIDKPIAFASRIIKLRQYLIKTKKETIVSKQIVRSGTSSVQTLTKPITVRVKQILFLRCILP